MKNFLSLLRHLLTFAAGLGTFIATSAPQADGGGVDPAAAGLGALAAVAVRFLLSLAPVAGAGEVGANGGRNLAWILSAGLAGFFGFSLPACTAGFPQVRARYTEPGATVEYSSAKGVMVVVDRRGVK